MAMLPHLLTAPVLGISNANVNRMGPGCINFHIHPCSADQTPSLNLLYMCTSPLSPVALSLPSPPQQAPINPGGESVVDL